MNIKTMLRIIAVASAVATAGCRIEPPNLKKIDFGDINKDFVSGMCEVDCNGWGAFDTDTWARMQINGICCMKLGVEPERMRVEYSADSYNEAEKRWHYEFKAFVRAPMVIDYNPLLRSGVCIGDLGLLNLSVEAATRRIKKFVISEMRTRAGAVKSASGLDDVLVRFGKTDVDRINNTIKVEFRLP